MSYSICGFTANVNDVVSVCLSAAGVCTAKPFKTDTCKGGVNMYMFDTVRTGYDITCFSFSSSSCTSYCTALLNRFISNYFISSKKQ